MSETKSSRAEAEAIVAAYEADIVTGSAPGLTLADLIEVAMDEREAPLRAEVERLKRERNELQSQFDRMSGIAEEFRHQRDRAYEESIALGTALEDARRAGKAEASKEIADAMLKRGAIEVTAGHRVAANALTEMASALLARAEEEVERE
jgi:seryl-tRNA synthetase